MSWIGIGATLLAFVLGYTLSMMYITVFYHRGFTHNAVELKPSVRRFVLLTGPWLTGLDVRGWACMHRMHHQTTDVPGDPHSPVEVGMLGVFLAQHKSYAGVLFGLVKNKDDYVSVVADIAEPVSWASRHRVWYLPAILCPLVAVTVAWPLGAWYLGLAFAVGLMSHPGVGWLVNSLCHAHGHRNFDTADNSHNSLRVAIATFGEGLHNNHHYAPASARLRYRWFEPDLGFLICRSLESLGLLTIRRDTLLPTYRQQRRQSPEAEQSAVPRAAQA